MMRLSSILAVFTTTAIMIAVISSAEETAPAGALQFGEASIKLGMGESEVLAALESDFKLQKSPPDLPEYVGYSIHKKAYLPESEPLKSYAGWITFRDGKLIAGSRSLVEGKYTLESKEMMNRLTELLTATSKRLERAPNVVWNDGKPEGCEEPGNRGLTFDFGVEKIEVVYSEIPKDKPRLTLSVTIGSL